jgi:hypothetical protein
MKSDNEIKIERTKDLRLYVVSGVWFALILAVLLKEVLHL